MRHPARTMRERLYRLLIQAYPESFLLHHEDDLVQWFQQHVETTQRRGGLMAWIQFWFLILEDLLRSVPAQHLHSPGPMTHPQRMTGPEKGSAHSMDSLFHNTRLALRSFVRAPAFFGLAVATLGIGIGFATTLFTVIDGVLLAPLPYANSERIVKVGAGLTEASGRIYALSAPEAVDLQARSHSFEALAVSLPFGTTVRGDGEPEIFSGAIISADFFEVLGVQPQLGRAFTESEDVPGAEPVVILSHDVWQQRWGGNAAMIGETITLGRSAFTVVGIMPADFYPPEAMGQHGAKLWIPFSFVGEEARSDRKDHFLHAIARLRPGVSPVIAQAEVVALGAQLADEFPEAGDPHFGLFSLHQETVGGIGKTLIPLFGAVGLLLLIACANVASLLLIRAGSRGREMALRTAIGANRGHITRQLLTESSLLGMVGGGLGIAIALAGVRLFVAFSPQDIPRLAEVSVDGRVLAFALAISGLTSLLFGWLPALRGSRADLVSRLKEGARGTGGTAGQERLRNTLVVAETSVAFVLVVGAGLLISSFLRLQRVEMGFDPENVQILGVAYPGAESPEDISSFYRDVTGRVASLPGVTAVGVTANLPLSGNYAMRSIEAVEGRPDFVNEDGVYYQHVSPDFFPALGIPLLRGRVFDRSDQPETPPVAVVNEAMASLLFGEDNPLGRRFQASDGTKTTWFEVIGLVEDVRTLRLSRAGMPEMYLSFDQAPHGRHMDIVVRTAAFDPDILPAMRAELHNIRPDFPVRRSVRMEDFVADSIASPRFYTLVLGSFAGVALLLALVGIYGTLAYAVAQRTHEFGVRMALGATESSVLAMVLKRGMALVTLGVALGLGGALLSTRALESLVFGITPTDATTMALGIATVLVAALLASWIPAWRATKLDPIETLRNE